MREHIIIYQLRSVFVSKTWKKIKLHIEKVGKHFHLIGGSGHIKEVVDILKQVATDQLTAQLGVISELVVR